MQTRLGVRWSSVWPTPAAGDADQEVVCRVIVIDVGDHPHS
jgi:hypothetical protein